MEKEILNSFLVETFNEIMRYEEFALEAMTKNKLSIKEIHIIEEVVNHEKENKNTLSNIAARLMVTLGTLSVAVKTLIKKGYIKREKDEKDKRVIRLQPTRLGLFVYKHHETFHLNMINGVMEITDEKEQQLLVKTLQKIKSYFQKEANALANK